MGIFGWSYPAGCSGPPDDYYDGPTQPQCVHCGAFLPTQHQAVEELWFEWDDDTTGSPPEGAYNIQRYEGEWDHLTRFTILFSELRPTWKCKRCGKLTHDRHWQP
jgi:hypothetical protein